MEGDYIFWRDAFDTYQSLSEGLKILWLIVPPAFLLALTALCLRYRLARTRSLCSAAIKVTSDGKFWIYAHDDGETLPNRASAPDEWPPPGTRHPALDKHPSADI